jgi:DNA uptake protein ComE-like DNA-binding protein
MRKREGIMGNIQQRVPGEKAGRIELNQADSSDWEQLPGIGPILASRIVKYRNRLGGFVRREQLLEVYGIDTALYLKLANRLQEETRPNELLHWQTTGYETLSRHPYIGRFIAGKIIRFREQNKNYPERMSPQNWLFVDSLMMEKLRPYLSKP